MTALSTGTEGAATGIVFFGILTATVVPVFRKWPLPSLGRSDDRLFRVVALCTDGGDI